MKQYNFGNFNQAKVVATTAGIVVVGGILIFFGLRPQIQSVKNIKAEIDNNNQQIARIQNEVKSYQEAHATLRSVTGSDAVPKIFPMREDMVDLVKGLEAAVILSGGTHAISLTDRGDGKEDGQDPPEKVEPVVSGLVQTEEVPYVMQYYGNFRQTVNLLSYLENLPYATPTIRFSFSAESVQNPEAQRITNTGNAFSQIDGLLFIKKQR